MYATWRIFYVDTQSELMKIEMRDLTELGNYLFGRKRRQLKAKHIEEIQKIIESYNEKRYGSTFTYYHNMMCATIVHPGLKVELPFAPEPVLKTDGTSKNDCEINARRGF